MMQTRLWNAKLEIQKCNLKVSKLEPTSFKGPRIKKKTFEFEDFEIKGSSKVH